jgi:L-seryl-tRNA(Ser) seleniumtransferase
VRTDARRDLPSVASLLENSIVAALAPTATHRDLADAVRDAIAEVRSGSAPQPKDAEDWAARVRDRLAALRRSSLVRVINASGVVLHTNLGRAPLAQSAIAAMQHAAEGYTTLEYDLSTGERGSRHAHCVELLRELTGAEDAMVVNNCAAALVLALNTLAAGRDVPISRGELIEIGGSFRIPEIMARSAARLVEVGTTNRTHLLDYRAAITERTAAIAKVHRSNFAQSGYSAEVPLHDLTRLGAEHSLPVVFDLGSGLLLDLTGYGFPAEPTAAHAIGDGADLVLMSGDKLLGGPQCGIVAGRSELITRMRSNPLARAVRVDKLTIAALEATLRLYRDPASATTAIPTLAMLCAPADRIRERARSLAAALSDNGIGATVVESEAAVGAGAFPACGIPSFAVALHGEAAALALELRQGHTPVIGRIHDGRLQLDLRSVQEREDQELLESLLRTRVQ